MGQIPTSVYSAPTPRPRRSRTCVLRLGADADLQVVHGILSRVLDERDQLTGGDRDLARRTALIDGDGSSADPAALGAACYLLGTLGGPDAERFTAAADDQLAIVLEQTPRGLDGVISLRAAELQLWVDSAYMISPFLACACERPRVRLTPADAGLVKNDIGLLREAVLQLRLLYAHLVDPDPARPQLLRHVVRGYKCVSAQSFPLTSRERHHEDLGTWACGNAWFAAGAVRTLATIERSAFKTELEADRQLLAKMTDELLVLAYKTNVRRTVQIRADRGRPAC